MGTVTFEMLPKSKLVWVRASGEITFEQLIQQAAEVYRHPGFRRDFDSFFDLGGAALAFDPAGMKRRQPVLEVLSSRVGERRWAIFAQHFGTLRSANMVRKVMGELTEQSPDVVLDIGVFQERSQALEWLGKPDPQPAGPS